MPKIYKNYIENNGEFELVDGNVVYTDLPVVAVDMFKKYNKLFVYNGNAFEYDEFHSVNKLYKLNVNKDGSLYESEDGKIQVYLPKELNISELRVTPNGDVVRLTAANTNHENDEQNITKGDSE